MLLRKWAFAGVAAVVALCSSPARSEAGIQVLVEELNASGTVIGSSSFTVPEAFSYSTRT